MTMIWLPKCREIELPTPKVGVEGLYRMVVREHDGAVAKDTGWFKNIITNTGLDQLATGAQVGNMSLGTGTMAPSATDTSLQTFAQFSDTSAPGSGYSPAYPPQNTTSPYVTGFTRAYRFSIGRLNGTYSEVGVSGTTNGTALFSRALIVDGGGAPAPITVSSSQQLDAYYTVRKFAPLVDTSETVTISGTSHTITGRAAFAGDGNIWFPTAPFNAINNSNGVYFVNAGVALGAITSSLTGGTASATVNGFVTPAAYTPGSYTRECTVFAGTNEANVAGGIRGVQFYWGSSSAAMFQYVLNTAIAKDVTKTMNLNFSVSWARV